MLNVHMSDAELALFKSFLICAKKYLEFGAGGSTYLAASLGKEVISVDSSDDWLAKVEVECAHIAAARKPRLFKVNIGPTGEWGAPTDPASRYLWPFYYNAVWLEPGASEADLFLVDGRFRVASFMSIVLHCETPTIVLVHDFSIRPHYYVIKDICPEIARSEQLSAFLVSPEAIDREKASSILDAHAYRWD